MADLFSVGPADLRVSPLAHLRGQLEAATVAGPRGISIRELPFTSQFGVRAVPGGPAHAALAAATGVGLPAAVGEVAGGPDSVAVLWLGPDDFLVIAPPDSLELFEALVAALADHPGQVVDLSTNRTIVEVSGPVAREALEKGVPADLHPRSLPVGSAITTTLGPVPVPLWRTAEDVYRVLPRGSFAEYAALWLIDSAKEYQAVGVD